ncbi:protein kinase domain-containing protein [Actinokineospora sp. 24-640]
MSRVTVESVVGGYRILDKVGQGGFGTVWRARSPQGEPVAVKMLHPQFVEDAEQVARLVGEFMLMTRLRHPNIVRSRALVTHGTAPVLVMEYVAGATLAEVLRARARLSIAETADLARQMASALHLAHSAGVVHRDVKPANILLQPSAGAVVPKLVDFGIALLTGGARHTLSGHIVGTPSYVAPEVIRGEDPSSATDVYALGLLIHECATGTRVFGDGSPAALLDRHLNTVPALPVDWPDPLRALVAACLHKDPAARPTAGDIVAALSREGGPAQSTTLLATAGDLGPPTAALPVLAPGRRVEHPLTASFSLPDQATARVAPRERRKGPGPAIPALLAGLVLVGAVLIAVVMGSRPDPAIADAPRPETSSAPATGGTTDQGATVPTSEPTEAPLVTGPVTGSPTRPGQPAPGTTQSAVDSPSTPGGQPDDRGTVVVPPPAAPTTTRGPVVPPPRQPTSAVNDTDVPIADGSSRVASSRVTLAASGTRVGDPGVEVVVDIRVVHANRGDLSVVVVAPNGRRHSVLAPNPRDHRSDYSVRLTLTDAFPAGTPVDGSWRLDVNDRVAGGTGRIDRWAVTA